MMDYADKEARQLICIHGPEKAEQWARGWINLWHEASCVAYPGALEAKERREYWRTVLRRIMETEHA